jgi:hypothetical protein
MRSVPAFIAAGALAGALLLAPAAALAQTQAQDPLALRKAQDEFARLQAQLARTNAEIAQLKRADRSVRDDYRLRDRMADADALAKKLTRLEARLRPLEKSVAPPPAERPLLAPVQVSPQDGSIELEAKADLFSDQASKLVQQADLLTKAADQLRARKALRRRAGAWDRDPFAGLESSKRNLAVAQAAQKAPSAPTDSAPRGGTGTTGAAGPGSGPTFGGSGPTVPPAANPGAETPGGSTTDSSGRTSPTSGAPESPLSKSSPLALGAAPDRQADQRFYLDPTSAAELRQALSAAAGNADPDALDRAAATLRARARNLGLQADSLRRKSRAP